MKKMLLALAVLLALAALFAGCATSNPNKSEAPGASPTETAAAGGALAEADVAYAEPLVDNLLAGIKDRDYAVFSRDFSDNIKPLLTEDAMGSLADLLASKIGDYQSRSFGQAENVTQNGILYTVIIYTAKYSDEPGDVLITVTFNADKKVEGLVFNSPKLREQ